MYCNSKVEVSSYLTEIFLNVSISISLIKSTKSRTKKTSNKFSVFYDVMMFMFVTQIQKKRIELLENKLLKILWHKKIMENKRIFSL